jgi:phosphoribosylamine---glycine ligase
MDILILGSGGREHALAWKIKQSKKAGKIYIAPGNAGTALVGINLDIQVNDFGKIKQAVLDNQIELVLVGPEDPLVNGIVDFFKSDASLNHILMVGPTKYGAQLEGSKEFAKIFMNKYNIPTAKYKSFDISQLNDALAFLDKLKPPYVLKADGLAAGKGVVILSNLDDTKNELTEMLSGKFGNASKKVVIEEFLSGIELSVFVLTDGENYLILPEAKDYKRIGEGDTGPNTGGMGAISPVPFANINFMKKVEEKIIKPTIHGIRQEGIDYKGFLFIGLIKVDNEPYVIEYNVRMGDPETEVVMPRIQNDLLELLIACAKKELKHNDMNIKPVTCSTVILASKGYPGEYEKGCPIKIDGLVSDALVFHAGTKATGNQTITNGGRVFAVSATGHNMQTALEKSYQMIEKIHFEGKTYRKDIGFDLNK